MPNAQCSMLRAEKSSLGRVRIGMVADRVAQSRMANLQVCSMRKIA